MSPQSVSQSSEHSVENVGVDGTESKSADYHFIHLHFTIGYYSLVAPFRPVFDSQMGRYKIYSTRIQKAMIWSTVCIDRLTRLRQSWIKLQVNSAVYYFKLVSANIFFCRMFLFGWTLFTKFSVFEELLERIRNTSLVLPKRLGKRSQEWKFVVILHIITLLFALTAPIFGNDSSPGRNCWDIYPLIRWYAAQGRKTFFLDAYASSSNSTTDGELTTGDILLSIVEVVIRYADSLTLHYMVITLFNAYPLTMWSAAKRFESFILSLRYPWSNAKDAKRKIETQNMIWDMYHELKYLSNVLNSLWSTIIFLAAGDMMLWLAVDMDWGLRASNWYDRARTIFIWSNIFIGMILAAEIIRKMQWVKMWLLDYHNLQQYWESREKLELITRELHSHPIGIGSPGFFQIDYPMLGQSYLCKDESDDWMSTTALYPCVNPETLELNQEQSLIKEDIPLSPPETPNQKIKEEQNEMHKRSRKQDLRSTLRKSLDEKIPLYEMNPEDPTLTPSEKKKILKAKKSRDYRISKSNSHHQTQMKLKHKQLELDNLKRKNDQLAEEIMQLKAIILEHLGSNVDLDQFLVLPEEEELDSGEKFFDVCEHQNDQKL
ncbi:unnamed protein product [Orchesella dallaii]|uniref:BZIP domain-containing protein n=1 Tax=Orchesella dallaii TaxID=48710 RepID=A0ABP1Q7T7_9HEXA